MASDGSSGSAKVDEVSACARQGEQSKKQLPDPVSYNYPASCTVTENHLPSHLHQRQFDDTFFSLFPAAAMHMLAWQWPTNLGYAAAPCTMPKEMNDCSPGQCSNQGSSVNSIFEYVNQLGAFCKELSRQHLEQAPQQHQYMCQHPYEFRQMTRQGSEAYGLVDQNMACFKDEQSKLLGMHRSEVPTHLLNRSQALNFPSMPMNYLPGASTFHPRVVSNFVEHPGCGDSGMIPATTGLLSKSANAQLRQGNGGDENCTQDPEKAQSGSEPTQFNYASPAQGLVHSGCPVNPQEMEDCLQHHYPHAACGSLIPALTWQLANVDPGVADGHGAPHWNGMYGQVIGSSLYQPRCLQHAPAPALTQVISTPFPLPSTSSMLPDLFNSLREPSSSTSLPSSSSPFQLSAQSAFSCMPSYDSHFLRPVLHNPKNSTGCHSRLLKPTPLATGHHGESFSGSQPGLSVSIDEVMARQDESSENDPKGHPSDARISTSTTAVAGTRHESSERCPGSIAGMNSRAAENVTASTNNTFLRPCPSFHTAKSILPSRVSSLPTHALDAVCKEPLDFRMLRHEQVRALESPSRRPSESEDVVYSSHQGGCYGGGRSSPPGFCNLLGQDQHVLMGRNSLCAIARHPLKMQVGALALCGHQALDFPSATAPCVPPTSIHEVHVVPVNRIRCTPRQPGVKGQWGPAEDRVLSKLVKRYGSRRWSLISTFMANRSGKQCRERWVNHLQPDIRKDGWTTEEEELLVHAHSTFGNRWSAIAKSLGDKTSPLALMGEQMLPGRTDNSIKNHWHAALRKKDRHGQLRPSLLREYIQKKTAACDLPTKPARTLQAGAEINNSDLDQCLPDSGCDKKDADHQNMEVDDTSTLNCYTEDIENEPLNKVNKVVISQLAQDVG